jgi:GNAT superfamily N-acetyltransferase
VRSELEYTVRLSAPLTWRVHDGEVVAATARAFLRPDHRWLVWIETWRDDCCLPLIEMVARDLGAELLASVDEVDEEGLARYARLGFAEARREGLYLIPAREGEVSPVPDGIELISASVAGEDQLRRLDTALRADVPGSEGWQWDPADFREETFESAEFDPATYLVAVDSATDEYAGLARIWMRKNAARLGLVAVLPRYRRRGLAEAMLGRALAAAAERGKTEVSAEVDDTNIACRALLGGFGGRRTSGTVELTRPADRRRTT